MTTINLNQASVPRVKLAVTDCEPVTARAFDQFPHHIPVHLVCSTSHPATPETWIALETDVSKIGANCPEARRATMKTTSISIRSGNWSKYAPQQKPLNREPKPHAERQS